MATNLPGAKLPTWLHRWFGSIHLWMGAGMASLAYAISLLAISLYAYDAHSLRIFAILWMAGGAAWLAGTVLGFLFGVPRIRINESDHAPVSPNTNLEQISDWLTKIIVGATLVQLGPLANGIANLSAFVGLSLGPDAEQGAVMSGGLLVFCFAAGFIWGYLWCSLRVSREMWGLLDEHAKVGDQIAASSNKGESD